MDSDSLFRDLKSLEVVRGVLEETFCRRGTSLLASGAGGATAAVTSVDVPVGSPDGDQTLLPIQLKGPLTIQQLVDSQGTLNIISLKA